MRSRPRRNWAGTSWNCAPRDLPAPGALDSAGSPMARGGAGSCTNLISVFDHVGREDLAVRSPAVAREVAGRVEAVGRAVRHVERVMGVIVREETLSAEGEQAVNAA